MIGSESEVTAVLHHVQPFSGVCFWGVGYLVTSGLTGREASARARQCQSGDSGAVG